MMLTDYNSGRWQCARTGSRRERESQKVKRGAGEDPRTKSKLKVSVFSFFPRVFVKYVEAGCFEGFVARRLFGRLVALPALISKSATVSNFPFWPTAPAAEKRSRIFFLSTFFSRWVHSLASQSASAYLLCLQRFRFRPLNFSLLLPLRKINFSLVDIQNYFPRGMKHQLLSLISWTVSVSPSQLFCFQPPSRRSLPASEAGSKLRRAWRRRRRAREVCSLGEVAATSPPPSPPPRPPQQLTRG